MSLLPLLVRWLPLLPSLLILGGCTHDAVGEAGASLENSVQPRPAAAPRVEHARERIAASDHPRMAALPAGAAAYGAVRSHEYVDGFRQDIALDGARVPLVSNAMTVLVRTDARETLDERVPLARPSEGAIRSEIGAAFPHIAMQIVESERSNDYGPYGLALGRVGADTRCLYMWQWIDSNRLPREAGLVGPASVRVRLCRNGTSFDEMARWTDHLVIGPQQAGVAALATDGAVSMEPEPATAVPASHPAPRRKLAERHPRRHRIAVARHDAPGEEVAALAPAPAPAGPRYLSDATATSTRAPAAASPFVAPVATVAPPRFGGDLPPEAFAGPSATTRPSRN